MLLMLMSSAAKKAMFRIGFEKLFYIQLLNKRIWATTTERSRVNKLFFQTCVMLFAHMMKPARYCWWFRNPAITTWDVTFHPVFWWGISTTVPSTGELIPDFWLPSTVSPFSSHFEPGMRPGTPGMCRSLHLQLSQEGRDTTDTTNHLFRHVGAYNLWIWLRSVNFEQTWECERNKNMCLRIIPYKKTGKRRAGWPMFDCMNEQTNEWNQINACMDEWITT